MSKFSEVLHLKPENAKALVITVGGLTVIILAVVYINKTFGGIGAWFKSIFGDPAEKAAKEKAIADAAAAAASVSSPWNTAFYENSPNGSSLSDDEAQSIADAFWSSVGFFEGSDTVAMMAALKSIPYQVDLSFVSEKFTQSHQKDLYSWLTSMFGNSWFSVGRTDPMSDVNTYVASLPKYV